MGTDGGGDTGCGRELAGAAGAAGLIGVDYYPLTETTRDNNVWIAWQFDRPERGDGVVQAFRRRDSVDESATLKLRGVDPGESYLIHRIDLANQPAQPLISGEDLQQKGLSVSIAERPGAVIFQCRRVPGKAAAN